MPPASRALLPDIAVPARHRASDWRLRCTSYTGARLLRPALCDSDSDSASDSD